MAVAGNTKTTEVQKGTLFPEFDEVHDFFVNRDNPRRKPQDISEPRCMPSHTHDLVMLL